LNKKEWYHNNCRPGANNTLNENNKRIEEDNTSEKRDQPDGRIIPKKRRHNEDATCDILLSLSTMLNQHNPYNGPTSLSKQRLPFGQTVSIGSIKVFGQLDRTGHLVICGSLKKLSAFDSGNKLSMRIEQLGQLGEIMETREIH
jgi:hypothetical protein